MARIASKRDFWAYQRTEGYGEDPAGWAQRRMRSLCGEFITQNTMNTDEDLAGAQIDKFTLDLMTHHFLQWCDLCDDSDMLDEPYNTICQRSFIGATERESLCCIAQMLIDAYLALGRNENPFDYGESKEMAWSELFDFAMEWEEDRAKDNCGILHMINDFCHGLEETKKINHETAFYIIADSVCFDYIETLLIFYPHAWSDYFENAKNGNLDRKLTELRFVCDQKAQDMIEAKYSLMHDLEFGNDQKKRKKPEKKPKEQKVIKPKNKKPIILHKHLYLMKCDRTGHYKIGISIDPKHREATLQSEKPSIRMVGQWERMAVLEKRWHNYFASNRLRGEWFDLSKCQVQFMCSLMKKQIDDILQIIDPSSQATA